MTNKDLKELRIAAGLTQEELGAKLGNGGYNRQSVSNIETGRVPFGLTMVKNWAEACGYEIEITFKQKTNQ